LPRRTRGPGRSAPLESSVGPAVPARPPSWQGVGSSVRRPPPAGAEDRHRAQGDRARGSLESVHDRRLVTRAVVWHP
jgi:hypothetical protein